MSFPEDPILQHADRCLKRTVIPDGTDTYRNFFSLKNYNSLIHYFEHQYGVELDTSYRNDVLDAMLRSFSSHYARLDDTNNLVITFMHPKLAQLRNTQDRFKRNVVENQTTKFLHVMANPANVCKRKETLSFSEALFGPNDRNAPAFARFKMQL